MQYEGRIIRPPSEANSLILQVTVGCSHNRCTFCPAYKDKRFRIKSDDEIHVDIDEAAGCYGAESVRRVFLCDGDPLIMKQDKLLHLLDLLNRRFPRLQRVGIYGNAKSILRKSVEDLRELKSGKLRIVYMGLESGDPVTLERIKKGSGPEEMITAGRRVKQAGLKLNITVLLGIAGKERSRVHAVETMRVLNAIQPDHVAALTLILVPGTPMHDEFTAGSFMLPEKFEILEELKIMFQESALQGVLFFSNHASNYLPLQARLPRDRLAVIKEIDHVIRSADESVLRSEFSRGL